MEIEIRMVDVERQLMAEIADERLTREDVAATYAFAIRQQDEVDFSAVNGAIVARWSSDALNSIKKWAWDLVQGRAYLEGAVGRAQDRAASRREGVLDA